MFRHILVPIDLSERTEGGTKSAAFAESRTVVFKMDEQAAPDAEPIGSARHAFHPDIVATTLKRARLFPRVEDGQLAMNLRVAHRARTTQTRKHIARRRGCPISGNTSKQRGPEVYLRAPVPGDLSQSWSPLTRRSGTAAGFRP